jgi:transposase InsO family protein
LRQGLIEASKTYRTQATNRPTNFPGPHDLIASPAFIVIKAADAFKDKTTAPNQLWQTNFTYLKVIGWGWFYLSTVLDDFSRYIVAWKLCTTMKAEDVTATLDLALQASGLDQARPADRPRLLSDNGSSYIAAHGHGNMARNRNPPITLVTTSVRSAGTPPSFKRPIKISTTRAIRNPNIGLRRMAPTINPTRPQLRARCRMLITSADSISAV